MIKFATCKHFCKNENFLKNHGRCDHALLYILPFLSIFYENVLFPINKTDKCVTYRNYHRFGDYQNVGHCSGYAQNDHGLMS